MKEVGSIALLEATSRVYGFCALGGSHARDAVGLRGGATESVGLFYWDYASRRRSVSFPKAETAAGAAARLASQPVTREERAAQKLQAQKDAIAASASRGGGGASSIRGRSVEDNAAQAKKIQARKEKKKAVQSGRDAGKKGRDKARRGGRDSKGGGGW